MRKSSDSTGSIVEAKFSTLVRCIAQLLDVEFVLQLD